LVLESTTQASDASILEKASSVLDRAWQFPWALQLICILLYFDMAMLLRVERGLWQWTEVGRNLLADVGWLAATLVAFSIAVSMVVPAILEVCRLALAPILYILVDFYSRIFPSEVHQKYQRRLGYVPAGALHDLALERNDDFLLRIYQNHKSNEDAALKLRERTGLLTGAALLMTFLDWLLVAWLPGGVSLIRVLESALGEYAYYVAAGALLYAGYILKLVWFPDYAPEVIYYPPLDRELREKERQQRERFGLSNFDGG
jgi:hypothetical protein